jgi:hypothetical protein
MKVGTRYTASATNTTPDPEDENLMLTGMGRTAVRPYMPTIEQVWKVEHKRCRPTFRDGLISQKVAGYTPSGRKRKPSPSVSTTPMPGNGKW